MTTEAAVMEPDLIGPTWQRGPDGRFVLPARTLGWQQLAWTRDYLEQPDGPQAKEPWEFTNEQARLLLWWGAVDERGRFAYRRAVLQRLKGWGKDPFIAAVCMIEAVGPCRFGGWDTSHQPIAVAHPAAWVQIAAVSKEQTKNTMTLFPGMISKRAATEYSIDPGKEVIYAHGGRCQIQAVTSSPRTLEGPRVTFVVQNETHHWLANNEGHAMARVMARNVAKARDGAARRFAITNAWDPSEDSVAQRDKEAWTLIDTGKSRARGLLYDSLAAPPNTVLADEKMLRQALRIARGDSHWVNIRALVDEIWDPETSPSEARRFYLNQIVAGEDAWLAQHEWQAAKRIEGPYRPPKGSQIAMFFDGSKSGDHSALVGCDIETGHIFTLGLWNPADYQDEIPREQVDAVVAGAFEEFDVVVYWADLHPFESYVDKWNEKYGDQLCAPATAKHAVAWDMRTRVHESTKAAEAFHDAVLEQVLTHDGEKDEEWYVLNARRKRDQWGITFAKEQKDSPRKIDWTWSAVMARHARQTYIALPEEKKRKKPGGISFYVPGQED